MVPGLSKFMIIVKNSLLIVLSVLEFPNTYKSIDYKVCGLDFSSMLLVAKLKCKSTVI